MKFFNKTSFSDLDVRLCVCNQNREIDNNELKEKIDFFFNEVLVEGSIWVSSTKLGQIVCVWSNLFVLKDGKVSFIFKIMNEV